MVASVAPASAAPGSDGMICNPQRKDSGWGPP
jgi:hypothetical protein